MIMMMTMLPLSSVKMNAAFLPIVLHCVNDLVLTSFPQGDSSNLVLFRAANSITVSQNFVIPANVHVVFDAPTVTINPEFTCPVGASFEIRNEGCEL